MLKLSQADYESLRKHGEETYPHERCGVILGHIHDDVHEVHGLVRAGNNRDDSPHNRHNVSEVELIRIQRRGREKGLDIIGFYHSHPDHPAQPSSTDLAEAHWIGCSYVITSVNRGQADSTNAFALLGSTEEDKHFAQEEIQA